MTGKQAIIDAISLLGRNEQRGNPPDIALLSGSMTALNAIYADLYCLCYDADFEPLFTFDDKVQLPNNILHDCFVYGVAYMLAQADNDYDNMNRFCEIYNAKRAKCQKISSVQDSIFEGSDEDVF